jgi:membrane protease YdiL (CAAX protease family)
MISSSLARLALMQVTAVLYCILFIGFIVKARFGSPAPAFYASYLRDFGAFLLLVPTGWCIWGALRIHRPHADSGDAGRVFVTGIVIFAGLALLAFTGTISALTYRSLVIPVKMVPQNQTNPALRE